MPFQDYSADPASNTTIGESTFIGPNMPRDNVRPALQQLAADGKAMRDEMIAYGAGGTLPAFIQGGTGAVSRAVLDKLRDLPANPEDYGAVGYPVNEDWSTLTTDQKNARIAQAAINLAAIKKCRDNHAITALPCKKYYIDNVLQWNVSSRWLMGSGVSASANAASNICLVGPRVVDTTIFEFGGSGTSDPNVARWIKCSGIDFSRAIDGTTTPQDCTDLIDGIKGISYRFSSNSELWDCRVFDSPVGVFVSATAACDMDKVNVSASRIASGRKFAGFLVGGYSTNFGFLGANGSFRMKRCSAFEPGPSTNPVYIKLFGYIADTWIHDFECAGGSGILIDGADSSGVTVTGDGAHQDVKINSCVIDGVSGKGIEIKNLNGFGCVGINDPYIAGGGTMVSIAASVDGLVTFGGDGQLLCASGATGIISYGCDGLVIPPTIRVRDASVPVEVRDSVSCMIEPTVYQLGGTATDGVKLLNVDRSYIRPIIMGSASKITNGINMDAGCGLNTVDGSAINPGCFVTVDPAYKVRFDGADARSGFGTNTLVGITG